MGQWMRSLDFSYSKTCVKGPLSKSPNIDFQDQLSLNADQRYCRMLQGEHSAILWTFIKLPFVIKIFILSIFEWPFYTGFTVYASSKGSGEAGQNAQSRQSLHCWHTQGVI